MSPASATAENNTYTVPEEESDSSREEEFATAADIESSLTLPVSPRLILRDIEKAMTGWMISIEGRIICEGVQSTFITGLAAVFATFYIFNLQYKDEAAQTLEFIQRRFTGINPERGTKTRCGKMAKSFKRRHRQ